MATDLNIGDVHRSWGDTGYWTQVETYVANHSHGEFTHSICPGCYDTVSLEEPASSQA